LVGKPPARDSPHLAEPSRLIFHLFGSSPTSLGAQPLGLAFLNDPIYRATIFRAVSGSLVSEFVHLAVKIKAWQWLSFQPFSLASLPSHWGYVCLALWPTWSTRSVVGFWPISGLVSMQHSVQHAARNQARSQRKTSVFCQLRELSQLQHHSKMGLGGVPTDC
jgi:hypothetical protein